MTKTELNNRVTVYGWDFELVRNSEKDIFYQCRGEVMYDDEHDQIPEPSLWRAAKKLAKDLCLDGYNAEESHSEKGWVEVNIYQS